MNAFATEPIVDTGSGLIYQVDPETGEVISVEPVSPEFKVDSKERADWVLGKMLALDAEMAEIDDNSLRNAWMVLAKARGEQ